MLVSPDSSIHPVPALAQPGVGQSYVDPVFGSTITRLTDSAHSLDNARGSGFLNTIRPEYPPVCPWSLGNAWLLLQHNSYFGLYTGEGTYVSDLPFSISASSEPRWSRSDPNILYFHVAGGNALLYYNVATGVTQTLRTFSEYSAISGGGEMDTAGMGDFLVLAGDGKEAFVYNVAADTKSPVVPIGPSWDSLYIAPDASRFTITETGVINEYLTATGAALPPVPLCQSGSHMDVAALAGGQYLVRTNSNDAKPLAGFPNAIELVNLAGGAETGLLSLPWSLAVHVSASDAGLAAVETYAALGAGWDVFTNEILGISLDGSTTRRLAHHRSAVAGYPSMPLTTIRRDGAFAVFGSNWGNASGAMDTYLLSLGTPAAVGAPLPPTAVPVVVSTPTAAPVGAVPVVVSSVPAGTVTAPVLLVPVGSAAPVSPVPAAAAPISAAAASVPTAPVRVLQFAYPPAPDGFKDDDFNYVYSAANTPALAQGIPPGGTVLNVPLPLELGAEYRIRSIEVIDPSGLGGFRFRDAFGVLLVEQGAFVPSPLAFQPSPGCIALEPELICPGGSALTVDIANLS
jgi:hypothetical protein